MATFLAGLQLTGARIDSHTLRHMTLFLFAVSLVTVAFLVLDSRSDALPEWDNGYIDDVDRDLFRKAMEQPTDVKLSEVKPKIAFLFLVRGPLPLERVWERFFQGHEDRFSVYVHASIPDYQADKHVNATAFKGRQIPSVPITWGGANLIRAERRLLAAALADPANQRFVLLSEACLPLFNFSHVHDYLMAGNKSFLTSYPSGWRYRTEMAPVIPIQAFRKGSQWFALTRAHAIQLVEDRTFYEVFVKTNAEIPDESYIQTVLHLLDPLSVEAHSVQYVHWFTSSSQHPMSYGREQVTREFLKALQRSRLPPTETMGFLKVSTPRPCLVADQPTHCYLFARKFEPEAVETFLALSDVTGF